MRFIFSHKKKLKIPRMFDTTVFRNCCLPLQRITICLLFDMGVQLDFFCHGETID
jgi:hypothetical protein